LSTPFIIIETLVGILLPANVYADDDAITPYLYVLFVLVIEDPFIILYAIGTSGIIFIVIVDVNEVPVIVIVYDFYSVTFVNDVIFPVVVSNLIISLGALVDNVILVLLVQVLILLSEYITSIL